MKFAYADPPYLGCGALYAEHHPDASDWNKIETHAALIESLADYDGWAMSASSPSLRRLLPLCPDDCRVAAWVKPFAVFKPNVNPAYAWEPIIFRGGRKRNRSAVTVRDWTSVSVALEHGLIGSKRPAFCRWILDLLGFDRDRDRLDDLFPGTGVMGEVIAGLRSEPTNLPLFGEEDAA